MRSAGDRAYYAAFLTCRDQLVRKNYAVFSRRPSSHNEVAAALTDIHSELGRRLGELRYTRNDLTYQTGRISRDPPQTLLWMFRTAQAMIDFVDALPPAP